MAKELGAGATVLSTLGPLQGMIDHYAVAVVQARPAVAAPCIHAPFLAPGPDKSGVAAPTSLGGSAPTQFVQPVVVDTEVMGDLVDDGDRDLIDDVVVGVAGLEQGLAVDRDGVRQ